MEVTAKELRSDTKRILEAVARGEEVVVTYRGKTAAKLVSAVADTPDEAGQESALFGMWRDRTDLEDVEGQVDRLRAHRY